jgi:hypothetical protein
VVVRYADGSVTLNGEPFVAAINFSGHGLVSFVAGLALGAPPLTGPAVGALVRSTGGAATEVGPRSHPPSRGHRPAVQRSAAARRQPGTDTAFRELVGGTEVRLGSGRKSACQPEQTSRRGSAQVAPAWPADGARRPCSRQGSGPSATGSTSPKCGGSLPVLDTGAAARARYPLRLDGAPKVPLRGPRRLLLSPKVGRTRACDAPQPVGEGRRNTGRRPRKKPARGGAGLSQGRRRASLLPRATRYPCTRPRFATGLDRPTEPAAGAAGPAWTTPGENYNSLFILSVVDDDPRETLRCGCPSPNGLGRGPGRPPRRWWLPPGRPVCLSWSDRRRFFAFFEPLQSKTPSPTAHTHLQVVAHDLSGD